jgi:hypothetical protein
MIFDEIIEDIVMQCFLSLPMQVIFAKVTPKHIEASSFALLNGISNFRGTTRSYLGTYINDSFVGVKQSDLSNYYILQAIGFVCSFLPLFFVWLLPSRADIVKI